MMDETGIFQSAPIDPDEVERLKLENLKKMISKPIDAETAQDFYNKLGERQVFRERYFPESLSSPAPETSKPKIKYQSLDELAPDLRGVDSNPLGTKTLHKSANMADDAALSAAKQMRFPNLAKAVGSAAPVAKQAGKQVLKGGLGLAGLLMQEGLGAEMDKDSASYDDAIIENPRMPLEVRRQAMLRAKNRYLKPQGNNE